jgi:hypothetical protein
MFPKSDVYFMTVYFYLYNIYVLHKGWVSRDARRITAVNMKYMKKTTGFAGTDYKTNTDIAKVISTTTVL